MADRRIIQEILLKETKKRLSIMEAQEYQFPVALTALDWTLILVGIGSSLLVLAACMMGVLGE